MQNSEINQPPNLHDIFIHGMIDLSAIIVGAGIGLTIYESYLLYVINNLAH